MCVWAGCLELLMESLSKWPPHLLVSEFSVAPKGRAKGQQNTKVAPRSEVNWLRALGSLSGILWHQQCSHRRSRGHAQEGRHTLRT